jgi:hypothetical protein
VRFATLALAAGLAALRPPQADLDAPLDRILDTYVRGGLVYYRALQLERAPLDRYLASLDVPADRLAAWVSARQQAFWINAYNALVLRTVINHYPIRGSAPEYPPASIRQIPGAFERMRHHVAGRLVTLDEIERTILAGFGDARLVLALGRGAIGSNRLRSEAYREADLDRQLSEAVKECAARVACVRIDERQGAVEASPLFGWREELFVRSFGEAGGKWSDRSPIERAVAAMVYPHLFPSERAFLDANTFRMRYGEFDWSLNDLGRGPSP